MLAIKAPNNIDIVEIHAKYWNGFFSIFFINIINSVVIIIKSIFDNVK